ncbi:alpha/beta fold hydrolase [Streptomyces calidiresistens]|uniref:Alpha/beta fold hydrolase n=1 Tax=Streptomyces calidiresistens TaxID=1485586 RepID=A0A7W3SZQ5_9ACTN|nr:alpha/beta fold hydrolase [Streptomyces calidiresistens]MBB0227966.1 alpha/beta fold hydrolase [Streptomyces calidiresistens]
MKDPVHEKTILRERIARLPVDQRTRLVERLRHTRPSSPSPHGAPAFVRQPAAHVGTTGTPTVRLFCFPYAGGGGSVFRTWGRSLPAGTEVWTASLPGRESRLAEPPLRRMEPLIEQLHEAITPHLDLPYVFFGHSMGALIAFELTRRLRRAGDPPPDRLVLAAFRAPHLPNPNIRIHHLPDEVLKTVLLKEGTSRQVLESEELMRALLPTLRADLELCDTYRFRDDLPLPMPLTVLGGDRDVRVGREDLRGWRAQAAGPFRLAMLPGPHFFIHSSPDLLRAEVARELAATAGTREGDEDDDRPLAG